MKPRTKLQVEVFGLSERLPKISNKNKEWAYNTCLNHKGFATKSRVICMDCGETFSNDLVCRKRATCPHCETRIKIETTRKRTDDQVNYFSTAVVFQDYQVIRNYELRSYHKKGKKVRYFLHEILQYWINPQGKTTMVGLLHHTQGYCDSWGGEWAIRKNNGYGIYHWNAFKYTIHPYKYTPDSKFKKEYSKFGIDYRLDGLNILDAIKIIPKNPQAETLLKAKQYRLLNRIKDYSGSIRYNWPSIKICLRNKYKVKDVDTWIDYLDLLRYFNKDIRNAKYVCPKNLKKEHDRLVNKKRIIQKKRKIQEQRKQIEKAQKIYSKSKQKFIGLSFSKGQIQIRFLNSVKEVMEEGDALKHCVFTNKYYEKNTLLFSAMISGEKKATVEVDPKLMKVTQIRGKNNVPTEYDSEIKKLLKKQMDKISERLDPNQKFNIAS